MLGLLVPGVGMGGGLAPALVAPLAAPELPLALAVCVDDDTLAAIRNLWQTYVIPSKL